MSDPNWSVEQALRNADTAAQIREMREEQNFRYRDRELKDAQIKLDPNIFVPQWQRDAYARNGTKELSKTKYDRLMESVFIILLLLFGAFLMHFID